MYLAIVLTLYLGGKIKALRTTPLWHKLIAMATPFV